MGGGMSSMFEHLVVVSLPMALGIIILLITLRRWLAKRR